jgi:hypothetical protein
MLPASRNCLLFENLQATRNWRAANPTITSGAISATSIIFSRRPNNIKLCNRFRVRYARLSFFKEALIGALGGGILGWTETQMHANIVTRQLQTIPYSVRLLSLHMSEAARASKVWVCATLLPLLDSSCSKRKMESILMVQRTKTKEETASGANLCLFVL